MDNQQGDLEKEETAPAIDESKLVEFAENVGLGLAEDTSSTIDEKEEENATRHELTDTEKDEIRAGVEAILFMSDRPLGASRLRAIICKDVSLRVFRELMVEVCEHFAATHHGIEITEVGQGFQIRTKPQMSQVLRKLVRTEPLKLSPVAMEVLAIAAYKQPLTKDELDQIRGVDSGYALRSLMEKRLVRIIGRSDLPGRPMLYGTTHEFLELFSLRDLKSLPPLHEVEAMVAQSEIGDEERRQNDMRSFSDIVTNAPHTPLFEDKSSEEEVEKLREEIARIPTSTTFIDQQKAEERRHTKLLDLLNRGLTQIEIEPVTRPHRYILQESVVDDALTSVSNEQVNAESGSNWEKIAQAITQSFQDGE